MIYFIILLLSCLVGCSTKNDNCVYIDDSIINIDSLNINEVLNKSIAVENKSADTINIDTIVTSCECVSILKKVHRLLPYQKDSIVFTFNVDQAGYISRGLSIKIGNEITSIILEGEVINQKK